MEWLGISTRTRRLELAAVLALLGSVLVLGCTVIGGNPPDQSNAPVVKSGATTSDSASENRHVQRPMAPASAGARRSMRVLTNGCHYSARGIPSCGALLGAAYGSNSSPLQWERSMGHGLGVHRTYWAGDQVAAAVDTARLDLRHNRVPWISFKMPLSWEQMRDGDGDGWARDLAHQLSRLNGPVWLAFHHEPEGDGDIAAWTAMQAHLAPIVRRAAPNVAYSLILTGWNQLYGEPQYSLESMWPKDTKIDLVGFDVYDRYGLEKDGSPIRQRTNFTGDYFSKFRTFAESHHVAWGLSETGHNDLSAEVEREWVRRTYGSVLDYDGVALAYFNTTLNSLAPWNLTGTKERDYASVLRTAPTL
jgi:hypothetical protein